MPIGIYLDMTSKLPLVDPVKIAVPTMIVRGEHDGIATMEDPPGVLPAASHWR